MTKWLWRIINAIICGITGACTITGAIFMLVISHGYITGELSDIPNITYVFEFFGCTMVIVAIIQGILVWMINRELKRKKESIKA